MENTVARLRKVLLLDALTCAVAGLAMVLGAALLCEPLGLSSVFLRGAGLVLLPFAAFVVYVANRAELSRSLVWLVVLANAVWVVNSALILLSGWVEPTLFGCVFVIGQAAAVALLTELEYLSLRRLGTQLVPQAAR